MVSIFGYTPMNIAFTKTAQPRTAQPAECHNGKINIGS